MKTLLVAIFALVPLLSLADHHKEKKAAKKEMTAPFRHVVCFKFKKEATPKQIKKLETEFAALKGKIKAIIDFEWGTNVSPENRAKGFTHCFIVTFKDQAGLDVYLPHKAHQEFVTKFAKPILEDVFVIDYIAE
ncbi:MAG: Dabb family protein [Akkermansiaceae bacterium]